MSVRAICGESRWSLSCWKCIRNALRADLVRRAETLPWCSRYRWLHGAADDEPVVASWPLPRQSGWVECVNAPPSEAELAAIRRSVERGSAYGSGRWNERTIRRLAIRIDYPSPRPPKKGAGILYRSSGQGSLGRATHPGYNADMKAENKKRSDLTMTAEHFEETLKTLLTRQPFKAFTIELNTGQRYEVDHAHATAFQDGAAVHLAPGGVPVFFDHESVSQFTDRRRPRARASRRRRFLDRY